MTFKEDWGADDSGHINEHNAIGAQLNAFLAGEPVMAVLKNRQDAEAATIASSAAVSGTISLGTDAPRGLAVYVPSAWTPADIGFEVSTDGNTWVPVMDRAGSRVKITGIDVDTARIYVAPPEAWVIGAFPYLRLNSLDTADESAENQGAERLCQVYQLA